MVLWSEITGEDLGVLCVKGRRCSSSIYRRGGFLHSKDIIKPLTG